MPDRHNPEGGHQDGLVVPQPRVLIPGEDDWEYPTPEYLGEDDGLDEDWDDDWEDNDPAPDEDARRRILGTPPGEVLQIPPTDPGDPMALAWRYPYAPSDRQRLAHSLMVDEVFYGGAVGGGKTEYLLAECIQLCLRVPGVKTILFRKTYPELEQEIEPRILMRLPEPAIGKYNTSKHVFTFRNGSTLRLGYLDKAKDRYKYVGAEYQLMCYDEATHMRWEDIAFLRSRLRMAGPVRTRMNALGLRPRMLLSSNPGGKSHGAIKRRYIDPAPLGDTILRSKRSGLTRVFVRSLSVDNPHLDHATYNQQLDELGDTHRRALKDGDWDVLEGTRFPDFRVDTHVIRPDRLPLPPAGAVRGIGADYGSQAPFAALWGAKLRDDLVVVYREAYKTRLTPAEQAALTYEWSAPEREVGQDPRFMALDPACWIKDKDQPGVHSSKDKSLPPPGSIADAYRKRWGPRLQQGHNARIDGWALIDHHLRVRPDGAPRLVIYDTCPNLIRTLAELPRDEADPEDVDCFVAGTMISTPTGPRPVETIRAGDLVDTPMGPQRVLKAQPEAAVPVARVELSDGRELVGTADHEVVTFNRGLVELRDLLPTDQLVTDTDTVEYGVWTPETQSFTRATPTAGNPGAPITLHRPGLSNGMGAHPSTVTSTRTTTDPSRMGTTSTTRTTTPRITTPVTLACSTSPTTPSTTTRTVETYETHSANGLTPVLGRISSAATLLLPAPRQQRETERARIVEALSSPRLAVPVSAPLSVPMRTGGPAPTSDPALSVAPSSAVKQRGRMSPRLAPTRVDGSCGVETVHALTVDGCALYYANGVLVTNTHSEDHLPDALRYLLFAFVGRKWKRPQDRLHELTRENMETRWRDSDPLLAATARY